MSAVTLSSQRPGVQTERAAGVSIPVAAGVLLLGGCLNGVMAHAGIAWQKDGLEGIFSLFGVGFFVPIVTIIAAMLTASVGLEDTPAPRQALIAAALVPYAALVLVPSSLVSWVAVGIFGMALGILGRCPVRRGAFLFACLAVCSIWIDFGFKAFTAPLTTFDAILTQHILQALGYAVTRSENILTQQSGFSIIVLADCSTWKTLPLGVLSFVALVAFGGAHLKSKCMTITFAVVALALIAANLVRLTLVSLSPELHAAVHGEAGRQIYDALIIAAIIAAAFLVVG